jgi:hypothetical protein
MVAWTFLILTGALATNVAPLNSPTAQRSSNGSGTVQVRAIDEAQLYFVGPERDSGREALRQVKFPKGNWTNVQLTLTVDSRATPGMCSYPNPTGDIFDRSASVFLVLDEMCVDASSCMGTAGQIELLKAITPFGTDTRTGPRMYVFDITPFAPLLTGTKYVGAWVDTYDSHGWWVYVDFTFISDPAQASPKPPASGITPVFFKRIVTSEAQSSIKPMSVAVPKTASQVFLRLFTTGHGAVGSPPCDEFCRRNNQILVDGAPIWEQVVWNHCNLIPDACRAWNACGFPSCRFDRSGWCPGNSACHDDQPCDQDIDVTAVLPAGETHDVLFHVENIAPGSAYWNYSLALYWY